MQPIDPDKTPKVHIPTLNHIGLWVDNLDNAVIELTSSNIIFTSGGIRKGACKIKMMYFILISYIQFKYIDKFIINILFNYYSVRFDL